MRVMRFCRPSGTSCGGGADVVPELKRWAIVRGANPGAAFAEATACQGRRAKLPPSPRLRRARESLGRSGGNAEAPFGHMSHVTCHFQRLPMGLGEPAHYFGAANPGPLPVL